MPEAIAVLSSELNRKVANLEFIDRDRAGDVSASPLFKLGEFIRGIGPAITPEPEPRLEESFLATKVPGYVGSAGSFMVGGIAGRGITGARAATATALRAGEKALGETALAVAGEKAAEAALRAAPNSLRISAWVAENAPIAAIGALSSANGAYKEALSKTGGDRDIALDAYILNLPIGASEILPLTKMLKRLDGLSGGTFTKGLVTAGKESFEEAAQEAAQSLAQNYVAQKLYDKDRSLLEDLQENAAGGGITGFLFSTLTQAIGKTLGRRGAKDILPGASTEPGGQAPAAPPGVIPGIGPTTAGPVVAPAGPTVPPTPVIARGMAELTGPLGPEDDLALRTLAKQDVAGTLPATDPMRDLVARDPRLSNAYAIYKADAEKAAEIEAAAAKTDPAPTDAQIQAENYKKGKVRIEGVGEVSIETAKGEVRRSKPGQPPWEVVMPNHYSQILGTKGADGDPLDLYIGDNPEAQTVYVINQIDPKTGKFDESKSMYAFPSMEAAVASYDSSFSDGSGPSRRRSVTPMALEQFQDWVKNGDHKKELAGVSLQDQKVPLAGLPAVQSAAAGRAYETTPVPAQPTPAISPPPPAPVTAPPVAEVVPAQSATRHAVPPATVAVVDPFSLVDEQAPEHASLQGKGINDIEFLTTRNATVKGPLNPTRKGSLTTRMTFFEDTKTGEVIGIGTYENQQQSKGGVRVAYVGRAPGFQTGMPLRTFLEGGNTGPQGRTKVPAGRFKIIDTVKLTTPVEATKKGHVVRFANRAEYDAKFGGPVQTLIARNAAYQGTRGVIEPSGEFTGAPREVTAVDDATPATALEEQEQEFTPDEAAVLFTALRAVKLRKEGGIIFRASMKAASDAIAGDADALNAVKKMLAVIAPSVEGDEHAAAHELFEWLYDAETKSKGKKNAYVVALTEAVSAGVSERAGAEDTGTATAGAGQGAGAQAAGVSPALAVNPPGTEPGASGGSGQGEAIGPAGEVNQVRLHTPPADLDSAALPARIAERFRSTLFGAAQAGLNVTLVQQGTAGIAQELSGVYGQQAGERLAVVGINDVASPNIESLYVLTAEVAHDVFASLSTGEQGRLQNAVRNVTNQALGITGTNLSVSESIPEEQREPVLQEERLVDATTRFLVEQGFNPAEAQGMAAALWRAIKDLVLRAARVLYEGWIGATGQQSGDVGARLAQSYFENRVKSWLAGDSQALSFTDFMGGGSTRSLPMIARRSTWFTPAFGAGVSWRWNPETFALESSEASADSIAAMRSNLEMPTIRYHRNSVAALSPDRGAEIRIPDFAAQNELQAVLESQFAEFNAQGHNVTATGQPALTLQDFIGYVLPASMDAPVENKAGWTEEMNRVLGRTVPNPDVRMGTLNEATKIETANKAIVHLNKIRAYWERRDNESASALSNAPGSTQSRFDKQALRTVNLTHNYTDAEFLFSEMKENVTGWLRWLRDGLREGFTEGRAAGRQIGVLEQMIQGIEGRLDGRLGKQYADTIDALVKRFATDEEHRTRFVVMMQKIAGLPVWFGESTLPEIRDYLSSVTDPDLAGLQQDTPESRALLAIAAGFARSNALAMHMLALRGEARTDELLAERTKLNEIIKAALSDNRAAFQNARRDAAKLTRLRSRADAILTELEKAKDKQRVLHDELMSARRFTEFYRTNAPLLDRQISALESVIGAARAAFEPYDGAEFRAPENPMQAPKDWKATTFRHTRDGAQERDVVAAQRRLQSWLDAHPSGDPLHQGADYNYAEATLNKLKENAIDGKAHQHVRRLAQAVFGAMPVKLEQTGIPALKSAARRIRDYLTNRDIYHRPGDVQAVTFSNVENKAMKALGYNRGQIENFRRLTDQAWYYFGQRKDLLYGAATDEDGFARRLSATLDFLHLTGSKRAAMSELLRTWADASEHYVKAAAKMGIKVDDDALGMLRSARGAKGDVMRMMSGALDVVFREMNGEAGGGGPWSSDPFKDMDIAAEYVADPNDLRQSMAELFSPPNVWKGFVAPIVNRPGTAMFDGPVDANGFAAPARVEDVRRAFSMTQPGDIVGFAENLFDVMGGTGDRAPFIESTIKVFAGVFTQVKAQKQESSMGTRNNVENVTQLLMNARRADNWPPEFVTYRPFDLRHTRSLVNHLSFHAAFGRNMQGMEKEFESGIEQLRTLHNRLATISDEARKEKPNATPTEFRALVAKKAEDGGKKLSELEQASKSLAMAESEWSKFHSFINSQGGVAMEFRAWSEIMSAAVAAVVQGPATAMIDTISLFKPIQLLGVSGPGLAWTARNIAGYVQSRAGSLLELFGKTIRDEAGHIARAYEYGVQDTAAQHTLKERLVSVIMNAAVPEGAALRDRLGAYFSVFGRGVRELISTGLPGKRSGTAKIFPRVKPAGVFTSNTQHMLMGSTIGTWRTFEEMTGRAAAWLSSTTNAADRNDPNFRFLPEDAVKLGYHTKFGGLLQDSKAFAEMLNILNQYGLTLEGLAKDYLDRKASDPAAAWLNNRAFARLLPLAPTELMQEASIGSRPSLLITNPALHTALPLVGWSIAQTGSVASSFYPRLGPGDYKDFGKGLYAFAALMGVGLAYGLLRDLYDEELLGKKANRLTVGRDNTALALVDRAAQVGAVGVIGDFANSIINTSTARDFSIDSRVFAVSSLMNMSRAVADWYHQGGTATYATVGRPFLQSLGLSGYMQYAQIINTATGAAAGGDHLPGFEQEARMTARINANNWLRVAGRGLNMEVRTGRGASDAVPNKATPWVREMALAAFGNDPGEFAQAHRNAVAAARQERKPDPQDYVKRAYEAQHPLRSVFKTQLGQADVRRLLAALPDDGRQDVMEAVRLFNRFGSKIGSDEYWGKSSAQTSRQPAIRSISDILRSQARLPSMAGF